MKCDSLEGCNAYTKLYVEGDDNCTGLNENRTYWTIYPDEDTGLNPYNGHGTVFVGFLPAGTHQIEFEGEDACGNKGHASKEFTVVECKQPVPICNVGIGTVVMPSNGEVTVWAREVDGGTKDDCSDITFEIRRVGETIFTDYLILTCADLGGSPTASVKVDMQVTDEDGNSDYCTTFINLQDNEDVCGNGGPLVGGSIATRNGSSVPNHRIELLGSAGELIEESTTDQEGSFGFFAEEGVKFVKPIKNDDAINGVNTIDLLIAQRHILGIKTLDDPYLLIAADVTNNQEIDVLDLLHMQEVILGLRSEFPNNQSWRYVPSNTTMTMSDPYTFEEPKDISQMTSAERMAVNFDAVKIGDLNNTVNVDDAQGDQIASRTNLEFKTEQSRIEFDSEIRILVTAANFTEMDGYQFSLSFDPSQLYFKAIESGVLNIEDHNVMTARRSEGIVTTNWYHLYPQSFDADEVLFTILMSGDQLSSLSINSSLTEAEAYRNGAVLGIDFEIQSRNTEKEFALYQNTPNPFDNSTVVRFSLPTSSETTLRVYDISGREIYRSVFNGTEGYNEQVIDKSYINGALGVLYYRVETMHYNATKKMISF